MSWYWRPEAVVTTGPAGASLFAVADIPVPVALPDDVPEPGADPDIDVVVCVSPDAVPDDLLSLWRQPRLTRRAATRSETVIDRIRVSGAGGNGWDSGRAGTLAQPRNVIKRDRRPRRLC